MTRPRTLRQLASNTATIITEDARSTCTSAYVASGTHFAYVDSRPDHCVAQTQGLAETSEHAHWLEYLHPPSLQSIIMNDAVESALLRCCYYEIACSFALLATLLVIREALVYKLPPRTTTRGYKAQEWENNHVWTGRLKVLQRGNNCTIRLEDAATSELFALCNYDPSTNSIEPTVDSSRYYVLRVEDQGRHAFIGLGFQERNDAFDLNVALQDHARQLTAMKEPKKVIDSGPKLDLGLREGQAITINLGNLVGRNKSSSTTVTTSNNFTILPLPSYSSSSFPISTHTIAPPQSNKPSDWDDFGSFTSAPPSMAKTTIEGQSWVKF